MDEKLKSSFVGIRLRRKFTIVFQKTNNILLNRK